MAGRAELAGVEDGDHGSERDEREGGRRVAVVELDDRLAGAQAVLVPVPVVPVAHDRSRVAGAARAGAGPAAGYGDERATVPGAGLHHHRVVREAADVREA